MNPARLALVLAVIPLLAAGAVAQGDATEPQQASYPAGVAAITHQPQHPVRGEPVTVILELADGARTPDAVSLLWCRVEPEYVCAYPSLLTHGRDGTWKGTIPGGYGGPRDVIKRETVHVGYNLTLRFGTTEPVERVAAPIMSPWVPPSFPPDADGKYYFYAYAEPRGLPAPTLLVAVLLLCPFLDTIRRRTHDD
jgi:hypothetical protein